jgi:hypothetical protein
LAKIDPELYFKRLTSALWDPSCNGSEYPNLKRDLLPITAEAEIGRNYLREVHEFDNVDLTHAPTSPDARAFAQALLDRSRALHDLLASSSRGSSKAKIPIVVVDELTALEVADIIQRGLHAKENTDAVVLTPLNSEFGESMPDIRPYYSVTTAFSWNPRIESAASPYIMARRRYDEFLNSHSSYIASQYFDLYKKLCERFGHVLKEATAGYFLKCLSLESFIGDGSTTSYHRSPANFLSADLSAWLPVLEQTAGMISADERLMANVMTAKGLRGADLTRPAQQNPAAEG